jgi:putative ABC transport system permease protein
VGAALAQRYHWKIGDKIPLEETLFPKKDGSNTWTFDLVGIYQVLDPRLKNEELGFFFQWKYLDETRAFDNGYVSWYLESVVNPSEAGRVAQAIDSVSSNSDHESRTQNANAITASLFNQFANVGVIVGAIMGAVFFTLIILTGNTMAQAVRERIPELVILKTIGFSSRSILALVLAESMLLLVLGGAVGLALAGAVVSILRAKLGPDVLMLPVGVASWLEGLGLMACVGLMVGTLPALRAMRLRIADALAGR